MARSILIVEDEFIIAMGLKIRLIEMGYDVIDIVSSGQEAIDIAAERRPDLTIMDIHLEGDINGVEAAKIIMKLDLAVVYYTADIDDKTFTDLLDNPTSAFLHKDITDDRLKNIIEIAINRNVIESEKVNLARGISEDYKKELEKAEEDKNETNEELKVIENELSEEMGLQSVAKNEYEYSGNKKGKNKFPPVKSKDDIVRARVFLIEDELPIMLDLKIKLTDLYCDVVGTADNYADGVKGIRDTMPDLVITDINLDGDKTGVDVAKAIEQYDIPFIFFTANVDSEVLKEGLKLGPYGYLLKPYDYESLKNVVYLTLRRRYQNEGSIEYVENRVKEKNTELKIEKSNVFTLLVCSTLLIVAGIVSRNITWLQWLLLIPSLIMFIFAAASLKKIDPVEKWDVPPYVSILIPAHNEEYTIEETVRSICSMDYTYEGKTNYEVIVLNDGSEDRTGEILEGLKEEYPHLRIVTRVPPRSGKGKGFVLNDGLTLSRGSIVGVFDADTRVEPDFLKIIIPYLNDPEVQGVQSRVKMYNRDENWLAMMQHVEFACFGNTLRAKDIIGKAGFLGGNGQLVKKESIEEAGGWDGFAITEDLNLSVKIMLKNAGIRYCGETAVYQEAVTSWRTLFRQRTRWAIGNFETLFIYTPAVLSSDMPVFRMFGILEHVAFYALNMFVFFGFIVFALNCIGWFVFHTVTLIRMEAPLIIGILSAFGFFPGALIALIRDHEGILKTLYHLISYWLYCFHLIPLYFMTLYEMLVRKERTWSKTVHKGSEEEDEKELEEDIDVGEIEVKTAQ